MQRPQMQPLAMRTSGSGTRALSLCPAPIGPRAPSWPRAPRAGQSSHTYWIHNKALSREDMPPQDAGYTETITFFTADGIVRFPGRFGPVRRNTVRRPVLEYPLPSWEEQGLTIGACFSVSARNHRDPTRRINIAGFCQSVDMLFQSVEDVVMMRGGEILDEQRAVKSGLHEELKLIVAMPYLWGVPPTLDCLRSAIEVGGGIVDRVQHRWHFH